MARKRRSFTKEYKAEAVRLGRVLPRDARRRRELRGDRRRERRRRDIAFWFVVLG
jgi:hypothetical protein